MKMNKKKEREMTKRFTVCFQIQHCAVIDCSIVINNSDNGNVCVRPETLHVDVTILLSYDRTSLKDSSITLSHISTNPGDCITKYTANKLLCR